MSEQKLEFKDIDYSGLKAGLIDFLRATDSFKDANFEGTFLNQLVNMFAYTGAIFGNYVNSMANEQYINTCNLYESGNMLGNLVGYKSHGFRGSETSVTITPDLASMGIEDNISEYLGWYVVIPKNTRFSTQKNNERNKSLVFSNLNDTILTLKDPSASTDVNPNETALELVQGIPMSIEFTSDGTELQSFEIPNPFVDWKKVTVFVLNDSATEEKWSSVLTWFYSGPNSQIYIPYVNPKGLLEILFAEGEFGKVPSAGKTIRVEYFATQGAAGKIEANMIDSMVDTLYFVNPDDPLDKIEAAFTVTQPNASSEGSNIETLDRIKKFAPLYFGVQNRLVNPFDYKWFVLGEYPYIVDAKAFNYEEAVEAGLLPSPCANKVTNADWSSYTLQEAVGYTDPLKIPKSWDFKGFYEAYTVMDGDILPVAPINGSDVDTGDLLNIGTSTALFVNTSRPCEEEGNSLISQKVSVRANEDCCTVVHFEVEAFNPNIGDDGFHPDITKDNIEIYIDGRKCFTRYDAFEYSTEGYNDPTCCCDREGDVRGWYVVKGIFLVDDSIVNSSTGTVDLIASILVKANNQLLLGKVKIYPDSCFDSNDVFVVPVPETGGYLNVETKEQMLEDMDEIKMVTNRNHILAPIYQTFDVRIVFKKDETSIISTQEVINSIRTTIHTSFLPENRKLGDQVNTEDIDNLMNDIPGVARARTILTPRSPEVAFRVNELGDYQLKEGEFPILGTVQIS